ncbi:homeobox-leucine zipper protein HDG11-like [Coffea arabica]|uniref:Homeobox-leucine zipper protein HDG11-like n=1 Tax=Coffea arabica TaxID=13443 RepID=A0A6P6TB48_COFAR|nr:homeobox-leucine zipper protein HDG11-like [Coffea arabica]
MDFAPEGSGSADEHDDSSNSRRERERKQYHRHSAEQIQRLEEFFKDCPHPDENQRRQLSRELGLEPRQIKFWFQNKRTQTKSHNERADNDALRVENDRFYYENLVMREALRNLVCPKCEDASSGEEARQRNLERLRAENAWLKQELERASRVVSTFSRRSGVLESYLPPSFSPLSYLGENIPGTSTTTLLPQRLSEIQEMEKSVMVETAVNAMDELLELFRGNEPLWVKSPTNERYLIHRETYDKLYPKISHINSSSSWIESSRDSGLVPITARHLIDIFQDPEKWMDFFPTIVTKVRTIEVLDTGKRGGSLFVMHEKLHVLSPLVAPRELAFLRYVRQLDSTTWVIVNVSYDSLKELEDASSSQTWMFPSGCLIQDMPNGKANVAWVEHVQVDDRSLTHPLYKDMVCDSQAYGAKRWIVTLQRMCERFAFSLGPIPTPGHELEGVIDAPEGRKSLAKLSHKMVKNFCHILSMPERIDLPQLSELNRNGFRVSVHRSDTSGQPNNMIVCVAASLRLPTSFENLFDFFKDEHARDQWDVLSEGNPVHEIAHISTGTHPGNSISLMQPVNPKENMLILQESSIDLLGANLIYVPVPVSTITSAISGQDTTDTNVLPSGFIISSDGVDGGTRAGASSSSSMIGSNSSLLTVAFQIMVRPDTFSDRLITDSVATIHALISSTVQKIRLAVGSRFG